MFVPERQERIESAASDQRHQYVFSRPSQTLRIAVEDQDCERMANTAYEITIDGSFMQGTTDSSGIINKDIPVDAENCTLKIGNYRWAIAIGHLNPMGKNTPDSGISGAQGRLRNLDIQWDQSTELWDQRCKWPSVFSGRRVLDNHGG